MSVFEHELLFCFYYKGPPLCLKVGGGGFGLGGVVVAHKILETAQSPNSYFAFLFDLGLRTWTRACQ